AAAVHRPADRSPRDALTRQATAVTAESPYGGGSPGVSALSPRRTARQPRPARRPAAGDGRAGQHPGTPGGGGPKPPGAPCPPRRVCAPTGRGVGSLALAVRQGAGALLLVEDDLADADPVGRDLH